MAKKAASTPANKGAAKKSGPGSYLFVDDDERIVRFRLGAGRVSIGREQSNDIWIEHPDVQAHALVIVRRDGLDVMKVYEGAHVSLNGVLVTKMHRLYGGDRINVADREFLYARDDSVPDFALGLTIAPGQGAVRAMILRQTRIGIGRRDADVVINDPSISERHARIEAYTAEGLFVHDLGSSIGTTLDGERIEGRARLSDGSRIQIGRVQIIVHVLEPDAFGMLQLPDAPRARPKQVHTPIGARDYKSQVQPPRRSRHPPSQPNRVRHESAPTLLTEDELTEHEVESDADSPPPTVIGALAALEKAHLDDVPKRTRKRPRPVSARSDSWRSPPEASALKVSPPKASAPKVSAPKASTPKVAAKKRRKKRRAAVSGPSVRVAPELLAPAAAKRDIDGPPPPRRREKQRRYGGGRASGKHAPEQVPPSKKRRQVLHDKLTDVLDTNNVRDLVGERYVAAYQNAEQAHPERKKRYRPGKAGGARLLNDEQFAPRQRGEASADPFGIHAQVTHSGGRNADNVQLTNMLDISSEKPRLSRDQHALDPDAMPQQLREQQDLDARRNKRGPIDSGARRNRQVAIDSGQLIDDED